MALVDRMVQLNARLQSIPIRFGVPQYRNVAIRHVWLRDDLTPQTRDTVLEPKPQITNVPSRLVGLEVGGNVAGQRGSGIFVTEDDFMMTGVPRSYSLEFLKQDVEFFVIDVPIVDGAIAYDPNGFPLGGTICKALTVRDKDLLTWELILRQLKDHYDPSRPTVNY